MGRPLVIKDLGLRPFADTVTAMQTFTDARQDETADECWLLEHPPVFTLGQAGKPEHILDVGDTPVVHTDRGGQVTWHGPGQLVVYLLLNLRLAGLGVRDLVSGIERSVIALLAGYGVTGEVRKGAPGVYVAGAKVAALGLRIRRGSSYHGLSLNVDNDLAPYDCINPCGYAGLPVVSLRSLGIDVAMPEVKVELARVLAEELGYSLVSDCVAMEYAVSDCTIGGRAIGEQANRKQNG
ncbi:MAG: lipoyl(octanoyl) transferase LipB [Pseudomonadales bacterium]